MMNMKRDNKGNVKWEGLSAKDGDANASDIAVIEGGHKIIHNLACISNGCLITAGRPSS